MNSEWACTRDLAGLPIAASLWTDGEYEEVRSSQVESGEGSPGLVLAKQRPRAVWTDLTRLLPVCRRKAEAGLCGFASPFTGQSG